MAFFMSKQHDGAAVAGDGSAPRTADPDPNGSAETAVGDRGYNFPNSRKVYVPGKLHVYLRIPFREITLAPTKTMNGEIEVNEPVRVYDTSGPWGDPSVTLDPVQGLPPLRREWILKREDVEPYEGREVKPIDDGFLSEKHATARNGSSKSQTPNPKFKRQILRAKNGAVTQLWYARQGIITSEMEFIAVRESHG